MKFHLPINQPYSSTKVIMLMHTMSTQHELYAIRHSNVKCITPYNIIKRVLQCHFWTSPYDESESKPVMITKMTSRTRMKIHMIQGVKKRERRERKKRKELGNTGRGDR